MSNIHRIQSPNPLLLAAEGTLWRQARWKAMYLKLSKVMKEIGFRKVRSEPCLYMWEDSTGGKVVVPTYVDDCQCQYIIDMLKDFGMENCAPVKTPIVPWRNLPSHSVLMRLSS
jgi:hypothetical protein